MQLCKEHNSIHKNQLKLTGLVHAMWSNGPLPPSNIEEVAMQNEQIEGYLDVLLQ
jgi:hypothetical protein